MNMQKLSDLADLLSIEYEKNGGWEFLQKERNVWSSLLRESWVIDDTNVVFSSETKVPQREDKFSEKLADIASGKAIRSYWLENISLFNSRRELIAGEEFDADELELIPIFVEKQNVGTVGLKMNSIISHPDAKTLIKKQSFLFNLVGGLMIICLTIVIFIFSSKYLISPIRNLSIAMKTLTDRNFDIRIPVKNKDELGTLARRFNVMARQLQEYDRNQKQWLMDISHELRTPLSALVCEVEVLKDGIRKPSNKLMNSLSHEIRHIIKLVNDINDISLIETGTFPIKKELIKPLPILSQEADISQKRFENIGMSLEIEFEENNTDLQIYGDSSRLKQLFINIIENAIRHTEQPGRLVIRQTSDNGHLKFDFEDSGPGVPDDALPFLFNRLYRVDPSRSRKTGGNGLGLAICKSIVEMHNGKIRARNTQGGGFVIEILLPTEKSRSKGSMAKTDTVG